MISNAKRTALLLAAIGLVAAACGGDGAAEDEGWITGLLRRVPDTATSAAYIAVVDFAAAADAAGITIPGAGAPNEEIADYLLGLPRDALVPDLLREVFPDFADLTRELGIDPALVSAAIQAGNPPETLQVLAGDFDPAALDQAVRTEPVWSDLLTTAEHGGVGYYSWGADFEMDLERVTPVRRLGRGGRLALDGEYLYWVPWTAGMAGLIDAGAGAVPTLADDPLLARVARELVEAGVYSAILTAGPHDDLGSPASARVLGIGGGRDDTGSFWVIAAIHTTAAAAEESGEAVRTVLAEGTIQSTGGPWSDRVSSFTVTVEGDLLLVVARAASGEGDWLRAYIARDGLLLAAQG